MSLIVSQGLLDSIDVAHNKKLKALDKRYRYPKKLSENEHFEYLTDKVLRKYNTLAEDAFNVTGFIDKKNINHFSRRTIAANITKRKINQRLLRRKLRVNDIGKMYTFLYDPKHKKTLPYYDKQPLVIPVILHENGFTGLNLHLLEPKIRLNLLNKFKKLKSLSELKTFMRITIQLLKSDNKYRFARVIFRRYLYSHLQSNLNMIPEYDWDIMQVLPSLNFAKRKDTSVWLENKLNALRL